MSDCQQTVERNLEKQFTFGVRIPLTSHEQISYELILREEPQSPSNFDQLVKPTPFKKHMSERNLVKKSFLNRQLSFDVRTKSGESTPTAETPTSRTPTAISTANAERSSTKTLFAKQAFGPSVKSIIVSPR